jgi:hypothetical protein
MFGAPVRSQGSPLRAMHPWSGQLGSDSIAWKWNLFLFFFINYTIGCKISTFLFRIVFEIEYHSVL